MGTQEMLRIFTIHKLKAIFQVMDAAVKLSHRAKTIGKNCSKPGVLWPHQLSTNEHTTESWRLLLPAIQWTSGSPIYFYCFYNRMKSVRKSWEVLNKPIFWQLAAENPWQSFVRSQNLLQYPLLDTLLNLLLKSSDTHHFEASLARWTLDYVEPFLKTLISSESFRTKSCGKIRTSG